MPGFAGQQQQLKPKRKSSEKRKAKSRDAARTRRSNEAEIFNDLTLEIPLPLDVLAHCDKASLIRLVICAIKLKGFVKEALKVDRSALKVSDSLFLPTLDGFLMVLTNNGDLIFVSENVFRMIGVAQADMLGQKVYEFIHPCDQESIRNEIGTSSEQDHVFFVRMRTSYNSKSHCFSVRAPDYKVVCCTGHSIMVTQSKSDTASNSSEELCVDVQSEHSLQDEEVLYTVIIGRLVLEPEVNSQLRLDSSSFVTRHSPSMKCVYCDDRVSALLGYRPEDIIGRSLYDYHHPLDDELVKKAYKTLFTSGQMMIPCYRFLRRKGGYSWLETKAVMLGKPQKQQQQQGRDQDVLCIHCVISEPRCTRMLMSEVQQQCQSSITSTLASLLTGGDTCKQERKPTAQPAPQPRSVVDLCSSDDDIGCEDDDEDCMQFMTEEILGLTTSDSGKMFEKLLKPELSDVINYQVDDSYEMKAPYIPLDDMEFGSMVEFKDSAFLDPENMIKSGGSSCQNLQDFLFQNFKQDGQTLNTDLVVGRVLSERDMSVDSLPEMIPCSVQPLASSTACSAAQPLRSSAPSDKRLTAISTSDSQLVSDIVDICSKINRTESENALLEQLLLEVNQSDESAEYRKCVSDIIDGINNSVSALAGETDKKSCVKFFVDENEPIELIDESPRGHSERVENGIMDGENDNELIELIEASPQSDYLILDGFKNSTVSNVGSIDDSSINFVMIDKQEQLNAVGAKYTSNRGIIEKEQNFTQAKFTGNKLRANDSGNSDQTAAANISNRGLAIATTNYNNISLVTTSVCSHTGSLATNCKNLKSLAANNCRVPATTNTERVVGNHLSTVDADQISLIFYDAVGCMASEIVCTTERDVGVNGASEPAGEPSGARDNLASCGEESVVYVNLYVDNNGTICANDGASICANESASSHSGDSETDDASETFIDEDDERIEGVSITADLWGKRQQQPDVGCNSVLKNLLIHGVDVNYGYNLQRPPGVSPHADSSVRQKSLWNK